MNIKCKKFSDLCQKSPGNVHSREIRDLQLVERDVIMKCLEFNYFGVGLFALSSLPFTENQFEEMDVNSSQGQFQINAKFLMTQTDLTEGGQGFAN